MNCPSLQRPLTLGLLALALAVTTSACKNGPGILADIGDAVDRGATNVVDGTRRIVNGEKRPPKELPTGEEGEAEDPAFAQARAAYDEGKVAYQMAEYIEAIDKFKASFAAADAIEDEGMKAQVQSTLYFNLGQAQLHAYEVDGDRARLGKGKELLKNYLDSDPEMPAEDREYTESLIADVDARIAELEATDAEPAQGD